MKKVLLGTAAVFALGTASAFAADLPARTYTKAPPPIAAPILNWTGFYIGAEGGGGWGHDNWTFVPPVSVGTVGVNPDGALAGGVVGYNWQTPGGFLFGIEGSFDWADLHGSSLCPSGLANCNSKLEDLFTATGRIGYAWSSVLLYAKGGYAYAHQNLAINTLGGALVESRGQGRDGWTVGVGLEYMFAPSWSAKVEYDYYDFGGTTSTLLTPVGLPFETVNSDVRLHTVKAGINYHFNWGGPVVARY